MKKILALILVLALCLSLCACFNTGNPKKAFDNSKEAFDHITLAYIATNEFSHDIYEARFQGINNRSDYDDESEMAAFASEVSIELEYIEQAVANLLEKDHYEYGDWTFLPFLYGGSYMSAWVSVISEAYKCSGKAAEIEEHLNAAKELMKQLGDQYSDYEHYPSLKKYFTNTLAFFDFCCNPEGSFEQIVSTFNNYRNNAREYFFDLNYVFGDSIGGMDDYLEADEAESEDSEDAQDSEMAPTAAPAPEATAPTEGY